MWFFFKKKLFFANFAMERVPAWHFWDKCPQNPDSNRDDVFSAISTHVMHDRLTHADDKNHFQYFINHMIKIKYK